MLTSGDVVDVDLGTPMGRETDFRHPAVVMTAQRVLDASPSVLQIVPLTSTVRGFASEVEIDPDPGNDLQHRSSARCQHGRAVSTSRVADARGNVGAAVLTQIRDVLGLILAFRVDGP